MFFLGFRLKAIGGPGHFLPDCCAFFWLHGLCCCVASCLSFPSRAAIRAKYNLKADPCGDCCTHFFCLTCALCQESRELKARGHTPTNPMNAPVQTMVPPQQQVMVQQPPGYGQPVPATATGMPVVPPKQV